MSLPEFFAAIGSDHYLSPRDVIHATAPHREIDHAWTIYTDHFGGFCGSRLDPDYWRHEHPARHLGTLAIDADAPVLVVGADPSFERHARTLRQIRSRIVLMTSPEGADALFRYAMVPDVVVVDRETAADHARGGALARCPLVAVNPRTPAAIVAGVPVEHLFVPDAFPTWGCWPATAVAMAAAAGAGRIGLLGVDLGTADAPDPRQTPLVRLLSLLALTANAACLDCGPEGARKAGWPVATLEEMAARRPPALPEVTRRPWTSPDARINMDRERVRSLEPLLSRARALFLLGLRARDGRLDPRRPRIVEDAMSELLVWRQNAQVRIALQDTMGLSILPRLWRTGVRGQHSAQLSQTLLLATDEIVRQAEKLETRLDLRLCA